MEWKFRVLFSLVIFVIFGVLIMLSSTEIKKVSEARIAIQTDVSTVTAISARDRLLTKLAERQEMRIQQLKNYCFEHSNEKLPWDRKRQLDQFLVDDDNKFIYCAVPKVGTTPMRMTLLRLRNDSRIKLTGGSVHLPKYWRRLSDQEFNETELSKRQNTHFNFLFVREPFHRLLSGYKDKFFGKNRVYTNRYRRLIVKALRPQDEEEVATETNNVTFTEFLTYLLSDRNPMIRDGHWKQVQKLCFPCAFDFDFIGHFETLQEDTDYLLSKTGFNDRVKFPVVRTSQISSDFLEYYSEVPKEIIFKLGEAFRSDFEMFGYAFPGPLKSLLKNYFNNSTQTVKILDLDEKN